MNSRYGNLLLWGLALSLLAPTLAFGATVCAPLSPVSDNVLTYGTDYRPRLDFQAPDVVQPAGLALTEEVAFPLHAWNLLDGLRGAAFRIVSNAQDLQFLAASEFSAVVTPLAVTEDGLAVLDVMLTGMNECGPVILGEALASGTPDSGSIFVVLDGYDGVGLPHIQDAAGADRPAVAPFHGAFAGAFDPYHGQPPLCEEPLPPVTDLTAVQSGGLVIELGWTAGNGDATMIRYRMDGHAPTSIHDGDLLAVFPAFAGQWQTLIHTNPDVPQYWYTAFNVRLDGETVDLGSGLECGSFTSATVDESVSNEDAS
ncbi:hypothetical protein KDK88_09290, partial [bacterium]|nr:hypothetical protein [bacterium]